MRRWSSSLDQAVDVVVAGFLLRVIAGSTMSASLCGGTIGSRRGLLASLWSVLTILTGVAFLLALIFTLSAKDDGEYQYYYDEGEEEREQDIDPEIAVTSRAMAFAALWTAVLATLMGIFGTVILGWQSPTGQYYTCCSSQVHRTTPLALGSFIGSLIMFANLTLVCSVLFGEFEVRRCELWIRCSIVTGEDLSPRRRRCQ